MDNAKKTITRFAPSPTGFLHIGGARTALFNYFFAKRNKGEFILRIEDTDKARSKKEYEEDILESLKWLGLDYSAFYRQSDRTNVYRKYLEKLIESDSAYISEEEREGKSSPVIRLKNPGKIITFSDEIRGEVTFDTKELGDFVIAKNLDEALYHFVVVVDDFEMGVTHIIRGEEHLSNTPRQILIQEALGISRPVYAHIPLILNSDKSKMSKRGGATSVKEYRKMGYLPEALINFLAFLGWSAQSETNEEIFSLNEIINKFDIAHIQKGGAIFNIEKLDWMNKEHLKKLDLEKLMVSVQPFTSEEFRKLNEHDSAKWERIISVEKERLIKLCDIKNLPLYYIDKPLVDFSLVINPKGGSAEEAKKHLTKISEIIMGIKTDFTIQELKEVLWPYAEKEGKGNVLWPMRVALSGAEKSPDPFSLAYILGKEETLKRITDAIKNL